MDFSRIIGPKNKRKTGYTVCPPCQKNDVKLISKIKKSYKKNLVDIENNYCNLLSEHIFIIEHMFSRAIVSPGYRCSTIYRQHRIRYLSGKTGIRIVETEKFIQKRSICQHRYTIRPPAEKKAGLT